MVVAGWVIVVVVGAVVLTTVLAISGNAVIAVAQDALPYLLVAAWPVAFFAALSRHWLLAAAAAVLVAFHMGFIGPRLVPNRMPRWARTAPRVVLGVANVFIDNETPELLAAEMVDAGADAWVIVESNPRFLAAFDAAGGARAYPHRLRDPADHSDYAVSIASRLPLDNTSAMETHGSIRFARARLRCDGATVTVIGLNPWAVVDPGGFGRWDEQFRDLAALVPHIDRPLVLAGDLNTTQYRPGFRRLLRLGLVDAHDSLGQGLDHSFQVSASGPLAAIGSVARLDHALLSPGVRALELTDLDPAGSDHRPFLATLAIRRLRSGRGRTRRGPDGDVA